MAIFKDTETNTAFPTGAAVTNCKPMSTALDSIPSVLSYSNYSKDSFVYSLYPIEISGDIDEISSGEFDYGLGGVARSNINIDGVRKNGIGMFYFISRLNKSKIESAFFGGPCTPPIAPAISFWEYLSSFWGRLKDKDKSVWENYWKSVTDIGFELTSQADRYLDSISPKDAHVCVYELNYDILVGPRYAIPTRIDPTTKGASDTIRPLSIKLMQPVVDGDTWSREDMIELSPSDYYAVRDIAVDNYVVIKSSSGAFEDQAFLVKNMLSSEESYSRKESGTITNSNSSYETDCYITVVSNTDTPMPNFKFMITHEHVYGQLNPQYEISWYSDANDGIDGVVINVKQHEIPNVFGVASALNDDPQNMGRFTFEGKDPSSSWGVYAAYTPSMGNHGAMFPDASVKFSDLESYIPSQGSSDRYWNPTSVTIVNGVSTADASSYKYYIQVYGDLTKFDSIPVVCHFTTGRSYSVDDEILTMPGLRSNITSEDDTYKNGTDFTFYNSVIEFRNDIFIEDSIPVDSYLYSLNSSKINTTLFDQFGGLVGITDWKSRGYDNISAKASVSAVVKAMQNSGYKDEYEKALGILYGMPVSPDDAKVHGVYESYGYKIVSVNGTSVKLQIESGSELHKFIQPGSTMLCDSGYEVTIISITSRKDAIIVCDDTNTIYDGAKLYLKLQNRFEITSFDKDTGRITVKSASDSGGLQHLVDMFNIKYDGLRLPEFIVYGNSDGNDGVYHMSSASFDGQNVSIGIYKYEGGKALYNDSINASRSNDGAFMGYIHLPWPTHKFVYMYLKNLKSNYVMYMDAPVDTWLDYGDDVEKYDRVTRNVSVLNSSDFPGWSEYSGFRMQNGMHEQSDILELTNTIVGSEFGQYFPSEIKA